MNLLYFEKPTRYINHEINAIIKHKQGLISFALCFPDIYEVGMSHLGLKILYKILNSIPDVCAERVFAPWHDLEQYMKVNNIKLYSLETNRPLDEFDIVGFSLQYELSYTTILNMLALGGIPIKWQERMDTKAPVVIAGGPCTVNPLPVSSFIDAFLIGDGEEAVVELVEIFKEWKKSSTDRYELLKAISEIEGFYVPCLPGKVKRRFITDLEGAPFPESQIVPYAKIVHDRVSIEVSRGCTSGCRFCQAGMIYRPLRYRSPEKIFNIAKELIKNTGYEELSLLSFSIGSYPYLTDLIDCLNKYFEGTGVGISIPSIRADKVTKELLQKIKFVRKTGFTIAPEAGSERLRKLINKNLTNEEIERACAMLFEEGWHHIKLYFMIGLPTENDEDIEEIINLTRKIIKIARSYTKKFVDLSVTVSPFIPKPHTPFQWLGQIDFDDMKRRLDYIKSCFHKTKINYKGHDPKMSIIEACLSRGDENISNLIETVWKKGEKLSAWSDFFDFERWLKAMDETGINIFDYASRHYSISDELPWDFIDVGISKNFLKREFQKAFSIEQTEDCSIKCQGCGILKCNGQFGKNTMKTEICLTLDKHDLTKAEITRVRFCHEKKGMMKYLSQLELGNLITRALRIAKIPFILSKGFHPKPEISFGPSLPVGIESEKEYFDLKIYGSFNLEYVERLNRVLPEGLKIKDAKTIASDVPSLNSFICRYEYLVKANLKADFDHFEKIKIVREDKIYSLKEFVEKVETNNEGVCIIVKDGIVKARISEIVEAIFGVSMKDLEIKRIRMYGYKEGWREPL